MLPHLTDLSGHSFRGRAMNHTAYGIALSSVVLVMLAGCQQASVESFELVEGSAVRSMMRGDVRHGWEVIIRPDGAQHWVHWENGQLVADVNIEAGGRVSDASYEIDGYQLEVKKYGPGAPLGHRTLELLAQVRAEADRRQVLLPEEQHDTGLASGWMAQGPTTAR